MLTPGVAEARLLGSHGQVAGGDELAAGRRAPCPARRRSPAWGSARSRASCSAHWRMIMRVVGAPAVGIAATRGQLLEVVAGAEGGALGGDDDGAHAGVARRPRRSPPAARRSIASDRLLRRSGRASVSTSMPAAALDLDIAAPCAPASACGAPPAWLPPSLARSLPLLQHRVDLLAVLLDQLDVARGAGSAAPSSAPRPAPRASASSPSRGSTVSPLTSSISFWIATFGSVNALLCGSMPAITMEMLAATSSYSCEAGEAVLLGDGLELGLHLGIGLVGVALHLLGHRGHVLLRGDEPLDVLGR